jgi:hypothetical protein
MKRSKRITRLSDLRKTGPPSDYPVDVPQGGTWALWVILVILAVVIIRAGIVLVAS